MSEQGQTGSGNDPDGTGAAGAARTSSGGGRLPSWALVAAPAVALVVGVVLGVVLTSVGGDSSGKDADDSPTTSASDSSSPGTGDVAVVVPSECGDAAETVQEATNLIRENVSAIREFRTKDIVEFLNELEDLDQQARDQAEACSKVDVSTVSPSPTLSP